MIGYIYKTTNTINNKIYIGQHKSKKKDNFYLGSGKIIKQAILKYGKDNFTNDILEWCDTQEDLDEKEKYYIKLYKEEGYYLYNISDGGYGLSSELASKKAKERWRGIPLDARREHMRKAREVQKELRLLGLYKTKLCDECNGPMNSHKRNCSLFNRTYTKCEECGAKHKHFKHCSKFIKTKRTENTKIKMREIALNRDKEHKNKISTALKNKWGSGEMGYLTCEECKGKSSNHKKGCSKYKVCEECGGGSHKKTCSKYKGPKKVYCELCNIYITGEGNFKSHLKGKPHLSKLNK